MTVSPGANWVSSRVERMLASIAWPLIAIDDVAVLDPGRPRPGCRPDRVLAGRVAVVVEEPDERALRRPAASGA